MDNTVGFIKENGYEKIDYVLIENQPSNLNGIMKTIQHIIYNYFSLIKHWDNEVENVVLVNASLKTKTHDYTPDIKLADDISCVKNSRNFKKNKYQYNKKLKKLYKNDDDDNGNSSDSSSSDSSDSDGNSSSKKYKNKNNLNLF